jgi:hypothetical protein
MMATNYKENICMSRMELIEIPVAVEHVTGRRPNLSTGWRWSTKGCRGIRLETVIVGGKRLTTVEMVRAFIRATTDARNATYETQYVAPTSQRQKQIEKASADLRAKLNKRTKSRA